jgi:hypothetical protein
MAGRKCTSTSSASVSSMFIWCLLKAWYTILQLRNRAPLMQIELTSCKVTLPAIADTMLWIFFCFSPSTSSALSRSPIQSLGITSSMALTREVGSENNRQPESRLVADFGGVV